MKGKILFLAGLGLGYVLGTRAGREKYEQLKATAAKLWNDPHVQQQMNNVGDFVRDKAPDVVDFVADSAKKVAKTVADAKGGSAAAKPAAKKPATSGTTRSATAKSSGAKSAGSASS